MLKRASVIIENIYYKKILKNLLKTSKLGKGFICDGAESGVNFEHIYDNKPEGKYVIGRLVDKALLRLSSVEATRARKDDIKEIVWNEMHNNLSIKKKTKIVDLASGGARYLRELRTEHANFFVESVCIDRDINCIRLGRKLARAEAVKNIRFVKADIFHLEKLARLGLSIRWSPNIIIASGLFIYFNNETVISMLREINKSIDLGGLLVFTSYETVKSKKLMRKTMSTSDGEEWILYYRKPDFWREALPSAGFGNVFITRDKWGMNNVISCRKLRNA